MANKKYEETDIQAIADTIREKTGSEDSFKVRDMANGVNEVYEAGKEAEQRAFWETLQQGGARTNWQYAFTGAWWTDEIYNPIYPITIGSTNTNMFYNCEITDSKVPLDVRGVKLNYTFRQAKFKTIPELIVDESTDVNQAFTTCTALIHISITGTFGLSVTMSACSILTVASMKNIISHLKNYKGTEKEGVYSLTLNSIAKENLEKEGATSPNGNLWTEYVYDLGWILK